MSRKKLSSGTVWEEKVGYSRAVRTGSMIFVSGTTAVDENGKVVGLGSSYLQTRFILEKISNALEKLGAGLNDVVRTRMYVINIEDWDEIGRAHGEYFEEVKPAATMVEVRNLINPELLIEIEVDAVITGAGYEK